MYVPEYMFGVMAIVMIIAFIVTSLYGIATTRDKSWPTLAFLSGTTAFACAAHMVIYLSEYLNRIGIQ